MNSGGTRFTGNHVNLATGDDIKLRIESGVDCSTGIIIMFAHSSLTIREKTTIWYNYDFVIETNSECIIGKDCMFSSYVKLDTADAHSIFDTGSKKNINSTEKNKFHSVVLEDHVWCGKDCFILGNCHIGYGSVVGAKSLVKGDWPNNCIIAGVPGRMIAKNRAWAREYMKDDISECGVGYIGLTKIKG